MATSDAPHPTVTDAPLVPETMTEGVSGTPCRSRGRGRDPRPRIPSALVEALHRIEGSRAWTAPVDVVERLARAVVRPGAAEDALTGSPGSARPAPAAHRHPPRHLAERVAARPGRGPGGPPGRPQADRHRHPQRPAHRRLGPGRVAADRPADPAGRRRARPGQRGWACCSTAPRTGPGARAATCGAWPWGWPAARPPWRRLPGRAPGRWPARRATATPFAAPAG